MPFEPTPFGKYTLVEKLAVGGMAMIYRAKIDGVKGFQKDLVIKQILPQYSHMSDFIEMFIDEAKISVNLNHANIVPVYELGEIDGALYIAMEYVNGRDTGQMLEVSQERGTLVPPNISAYVLTQVCRALDYAHNKRDEATRKPLKIIHRDVSPNNVIVSFDGDVKIIDFGIAKATIKVNVTQFGTLKGKMIYMSPEQASEQQIDHRSDIYSAGILLYELATCKQPYGGDNFALLQENVKKGVYEPPSAVNPNIPKELEAIILKAMSQAPKDRFQTAFEMERALSQYLVSTGQQVFDRDVASFMTDLFGGVGPDGRPPSPTPISNVPTVPNLGKGEGSAPTPIQEPPRTGDTQPGVVPPDPGVEQTPASGRGGQTVISAGPEGAIPGAPSAEPSNTPVSAGDRIPVDPAVVETTDPGMGAGTVPGMENTMVSPTPAVPPTPVTEDTTSPRANVVPGWNELTGGGEQTNAEIEHTIPSRAPPPPPPTPVNEPLASSSRAPAPAPSPPEIIQQPATAPRPQSSAPRAAPWDGAAKDDPKEQPPKEKKPGFFGRLMGRGGKKNAAKAAKPTAGDKGDKGELDVLRGSYDSPKDFLNNGYANYSGTRGMFLSTSSVDDVPLGADIPIELEFPERLFSIHGQVIWRRAKAGISKGKRLPAGLAIEFVEDLNDDLQSFYNFLGI